MASTGAKPLLIEIGSEEMPARMVAGIAEQFAAGARRGLEAAQLLEGGSAPRVAWTPRRLLFAQAGVIERQPDREEELVGPPARVGIAADGTFTAQATGFAAKNGAGPADLYRVQTAKGEYVAVRKRIAGRDAAALLAEIVPRALAEVELPRSMRWETGARFIRPLRWLVALLGEAVVPMEVAGLRAGQRSRGHRALAPGNFEIAHAGEYPELWRRNFVASDAEERRRRIEAAMATALEGTGRRVRPDASLLDKLVNLTEYPDVILGEYASAYLARLPEEVLVTVMRDHQNYFALETGDGQLAPGFLAVINQAGDREGLIRHGNERVLRARFNDAQFFWDADRKVTLPERLPLLEQVTFQAKLGSYRQKSRRLAGLAGWLAAAWPGCDADAARVAAELAKCDLTAELVKEFPELQGIMGGRYAQAEGGAAEVAEAIADQYLPAATDGAVPRHAAAAAVAIADKLDTLAGMFAIGEIPTGSADPFALRRQANGVIRTLLERRLELGLGAACRQALAGYGGAAGLRPSAEVEPELRQFFAERLSYYLREVEGFAYDTVAAVLDAGGDDPLDARTRAAAVADARRARPEEFAQVAAALKRMRNIVVKEGGLERWQAVPPRPELLADPAEAALHAAVAAVGGADLAGELLAISQLSAPLERFFNEVRVNADAPATRANRLGLLAWAVRKLSRIADFSCIVAPGR